MIITTGNHVEGKAIKQYLGIVRGIVVRAPTITQGFMGGLKSIVGGKIGAFIQMCEHAREEAHQIMIAHAEELGANAIIAMRYDTADIGSQSGTEVLCYGTAVII